MFHIFGADYIWLKRFKTVNNCKSLKDDYFNKEINSHTVLFQGIKEYIEKRIELDAIMIDFMQELTINDLDRKLNWTNNNGDNFQKTVGVCLSHLFNHETHHRGMISLYLEMLGKENDFTAVYTYG